MLNVMRISIGVMIMFCTFKIAGRNLIVSLGYPHPCSCFSTNFFGTFFGTWNKLETISRNIFNEKNQQ